MPCKILLVDDNEDYTDSIKDILEDEGYEVQTVNSGEQACTLTDSSRFDIVLMDIKMPGMNGVECFLRMKQQNPSIKVILFTAYALTELIEKAHSNGVLAVLKKPLDIEKLDNLLINTLKEPEGGYILLADDDKALCDNLHDTLTEYGYRVASATDAYEAIQEAERRNFNVLLLDLKMPKLNGLEVYRKIKKLQPNLVTIIMTGYAEEMSDVIDQAITESVYTMLPKPIDVKQLLEMLQRVDNDLKTGIIRKPALE